MSLNNNQGSFRQIESLWNSYLRSQNIEDFITLSDSYFHDIQFIGRKILEKKKFKKALQTNLSELIKNFCLKNCLSLDVFYFQISLLMNLVVYGLQNKDFKLENSSLCGKIIGLVDFVTCVENPDTQTCVKIGVLGLITIKSVIEYHLTSQDFQQTINLELINLIEHLTKGNYIKKSFIHISFNEFSNKIVKTDEITDILTLSLEIYLMLINYSQNYHNP